MITEYQRIRYEFQVYLWKFLRFIKVPLCRGFDDICFNIGEKRRQRTSYVDDELNWCFLCDDCMKGNQEYWDDMWNEYYSQVL